MKTIYFPELTPEIVKLHNAAQQYEAQNCWYMAEVLRNMINSFKVGL